MNAVALFSHLFQHGNPFFSEINQFRQRGFSLLHINIMCAYVNRIFRSQRRQYHRVGKVIQVPSCPVIHAEAELHLRRKLEILSHQFKLSGMDIAEQSDQAAPVGVFGFARIKKHLPSDKTAIFIGERWKCLQRFFAGQLNGFRHVAVRPAGAAG